MRDTKFADVSLNIVFYNAKTFIGNIIFTVLTPYQRMFSFLINRNLLTIMTSTIVVFSKNSMK